MGNWITLNPLFGRWLLDWSSGRYLKLRAIPHTLNGDQTVRDIRDTCESNVTSCHPDNLWRGVRM